MVYVKDEDLDKLLHDAKLEGFSWNPELKEFSLWVRGLRICIDEPVPNLVVELKLVDVKLIAVASEPKIGTKPSDFAPGKVQLNRARHGHGWEISSPSDAMVDFILSSMVVEALAGDLNTLDKQYRLLLSEWNVEVNTSILVLATDCTAFCGGEVLTWERLYKSNVAWWDAWQHHHQESANDEDLTHFSGTIPANASDSASAYKPPLRSAFKLENSDLPEFLLRPVQAWFECTWIRDWKRLLKTYPTCGDVESLENTNPSDSTGTWPHARTVDYWWVENSRACVAIRGFEHSGPDVALDGNASDEERVWTFSLQRGATQWLIRAIQEDSAMVTGTARFLL